MDNVRCHELPDYRLRVKGGRPAPGKPESMPDEEGTTETFDEDIMCAQCRQVITHSAHRIAVQGMHRHTFANPNGILYQIGCFKTVKGCGYAGPPTQEWSWFRGYGWQVASCDRCLTHLGWLFTSPGPDSFHGLILNRLLQPERQ